MRNDRLVFFFILLLAACTPNFPPPEPVTFDDPQILRGEWAGEAILGYPIAPLVYSPDGSRLFLQKAFINAIYDTETFDIVTKLELDESASLGSAQFSLDGEVLATTERKDYKDVASLWNAATGERLETFPLGTNYEDFVGFSRDLERFATRSDLEQGVQISINDASTQQFLYSFVVPKGYAQTIQVSPDLATVAMFENREGYTESLTVKVWAIDTGENLLDLSIDPNVGDYSLLFSPDGSLLALTYDNLTRIWEVATDAFLPLGEDGEEIGVPLAFSEDNRRLVAKAGPNIRFWDVQEGTKLEEVELEVAEPSRFDFVNEISPQLGQIARKEGGQLQVANLTTGDTLAEITLSQPLDLQLSLEATYVDETSYNLSGTLQYNNESYSVQGDVSGGSTERYLRPTTSPPPEASFRMEALSAEGEVRWLLEGLTPSYAYENSSPQLGRILFGGDIFPLEESWAREFLLERQP